MKNRIAGLRKVLREKGIDAFVSINPINRRYLSGFTGSSGFAVISESGLCFATDFRYYEQVVKECPEYTLVPLSKQFTIYGYLIEKAFHTVAVEEDFMTVDVFGHLKNNVCKTEFVNGANILNKLRRIKSDDELKLIAKACKITDEIMIFAISSINEGMTERQLSDLILLKTIESGAETYYFMPIVVSGLRSSMPHGAPTDKKFEKGDFVTIDMGVIFEGYFSDMTRTVVIGKASDKQKQIYSVVLKAQLAATDLIRPGMLGLEADKIARDILEEEGFGQFFNHALGHGFQDGLILMSTE